MAANIKVSQKELECLMTLFGIASIQEFPELHVLPSEEVEPHKRSLLERKYLMETPDTELSVSADVMLAVRVFQEHDASFTVVEQTKEGLGQHFCFFFWGDMILLMEKEGEQYQIWMLPYLPLAVGCLSKKISVFKNLETEEIVELSSDQFHENLNLELPDSAIEKNWIMAGWSKLDGAEDCIFVVCETAAQQFMFTMSDKKAKVAKPQKADLINTCTRWMGQAHAASMKARGIGGHHG